MVLLHITHFLTVIKQDAYQFIAPLWHNTKDEYISLSPADICCHQQMNHNYNPFISMQCLLCLPITSPTTCCHLTLIPSCSPSKTGLTVYSSHMFVARWAHTKIIEHTIGMGNLTLWHPSISISPKTRPDLNFRHSVSDPPCVEHSCAFPVNSAPTSNRI